MKRILCLFGLFASIIACTLIAKPGITHADGIKDWFHPSNHKYTKQEPYKPNVQHQHPPMTMVQLANVIDIVEHDLREDGTVVIQQPSVWGQARMTTYRKDFDGEMKNGIGQFKFILSARVARSDQVSLESQTGLAASLSPAPPPTSAKTATPATPAQPIPLKDLTSSLNDLLKNAKDSDPIQYAKAFDLLQNVFKNVGMQDGYLGVEPTIFLDEKKRYLDHLNELRRINMGDDIADSAGYGLYLVRMPVSIEPGQKTDEGHGAMLTVTAEHNFGPLFLQRTFRNLVINDLLDQLTPIVFDLADQGAIPPQDGIDELLRHPAKCKDSPLWEAPTPQTMPRSEARQSLQQTIGDLGAKRIRPTIQTLRIIQDFHSKLKAVRVRVAAAQVVNGKPYPVAPSDLGAVFAGPTGPTTTGIDPKNVCRLPTPQECFLFFLNNLRNAQHTSRPRATDIRVFLEHELEAAYDVMERGLKQGGLIPLSNVQLMQDIVKHFHSRSFEGDDSLESDFRTLICTTDAKLAQQAMGFLCWAIAVDAALLNEHLRLDIERISGHHGFHCSHAPQELVFYLPPLLAGTPANVAAAQVFQDYVKARWPLITFSLDPVVDQQNIADALSIRRDLQLAVAFAFSTGQIGFNQMIRFHRQISMDAETIALNRTVTCFSHRNDTFGWRFTARYQNPPPETNAHAIGSMLCRGGPGPKYQINKSKLERGQRELTAVIVMPSFLNTIKMDVRGNYFKLTHPENLTISSGRMLEEGRFVKELLEMNGSTVIDADKYRHQDLRGLQVKLEQIEKMLPMQSYEVNVPYECNLGGFDLFVPGTTALVPILVGYDGIDEVTPCKDPTDPKCSQACFFLYGKHMSILETKVMAGGRYIPDSDVEILSREVMRVKIAKDVLPTQLKDGRPFVEVQVATPNGVSNRVMIPILSASSALMDLKTKNATVQVICKGSTFQVQCASLVSLSWNANTNAKTAKLKFTHATNSKVWFKIDADITGQTATVKAADFLCQLNDLFTKVSVADPLSFKITVDSYDGQPVTDTAAMTVVDPLTVTINIAQVSAGATPSAKLQTIMLDSKTVTLVADSTGTFQCIVPNIAFVACKDATSAKFTFTLTTNKKVAIKDVQAHGKDGILTIEGCDLHSFGTELVKILNKDYCLKLPGPISFDITVQEVNPPSCSSCPQVVADPLSVTVIQCPAKK